MDFLILAFALAAANLYFKKKEQRERIIFLGQQLGQFQIEKLMQTLAEGYLRALGENDPDRRDQVWRYLDTAEIQFCEQFNRFSEQVQKLGEADTRISKFPLGFAYAEKLLRKQTFDLRKAIAIHAAGISQAVNNPGQRSPKDKAFVLSAELFLVQHTCHWFCNSKNVASARLMARHKVSYKQVLDSIGVDTRAAYGGLTGS